MCLLIFVLVHGVIVLVVQDTMIFICLNGHFLIFLTNMRYLFRELYSATLISTRCWKPYWDFLGVCIDHGQVLGGALLALGQPDEALKKYQFHYEVAGEIQDKREMCEACYGLGLAFQVPNSRFYHSSLCKPCQKSSCPVYPLQLSRAPATFYMLLYLVLSRSCFVFDPIRRNRNTR